MDRFAQDRLSVIILCLKRILGGASDQRSGQNAGGWGRTCAWLSAARGLAGLEGPLAAEDGDLAAGDWDLAAGDGDFLELSAILGSGV